MKVEISEYEGCYNIDLTPETLADVNMLVRMKLNITKELRQLDTYASTQTGVGTSIVLGRAKQERTYIK